MSESVVLPNVGEPLSGVVPMLDQSAAGQCWNNCVERLDELNLPNASGDRLHVRRNAYLREGDALPCTMVSFYRARPDNGAGTNNETAVHYLYLIAFHWAAGRDAINGEGEALAAWEQAYVAFSKRPTPFSLSANGAWLRNCTVDAAEAMNEQAFRLGILAKFLIVDYFVRLPYRGGL